MTSQEFIQRPTIFLVVQESSIGDLVTHSLSECTMTTITTMTTVITITTETAI